MAQPLNANYWSANYAPSQLPAAHTSENAYKSGSPSRSDTDPIPGGSLCASQMVTWGANSAAASSRFGIESAPPDTKVSIEELKFLFDALGDRLEESLGTRLSQIAGSLAEMHNRPSVTFEHQSETTRMTAEQTTNTLASRAQEKTDEGIKSPGRTSNGSLTEPFQQVATAEREDGSRQVYIKLPGSSQHRPMRTLGSVGRIGAESGNFFTISHRWTEGVQHVEMIIPVDHGNLSSAGTDLPSLHEMPLTLKFASVKLSLDEGKEPGACVLSPGSLKRMAWDVFGMLFLLYDLISIPILLAFDVDDSPFTEAMFWVILSFWTSDIILNFNTGVYLHGVEELRRPIIAVCYLRSWFLLDVLLVCGDCLTLILDSDELGMAQVGRTIRTLRMVRFLRLIRVIKLKQFMQSIEDHINSDVVMVCIQMVKLMCLVLMATHLVACGWYVVGTGYGFGDDKGWPARLHLVDATLEYRYFTALHWSLTQFTTGSMEVYANSMHERVFSVMTLVFALMVFSSVLSSITASMTQLRQLSNMHDHKLAVLRKYLRTRRINGHLVIRIMKYVQHKLNNQRGNVPETQVSLLDIVSGPLLREMRQCLHQPFLMKHPFFARLAGVDVTATQYLCDYAVHNVPLSMGDLLFAERTADGLMFFIVHGRFHYKPSRDMRFSAKRRQKLSTRSDHSADGTRSQTRTTPKGMRTSSTSFPSGKGKLKSLAPRLILDNENILNVNDWCCEGSLWTHWFHLGRLQATQVSEVLAINAEKFADTVHAHPHLFPYAQYYGTHMVEKMNTMAAAGCLTDLPEAEGYGYHVLVEEAFSVQLSFNDNHDPNESNGTNSSKSVGRLGMDSHAGNETPFGNDYPYGNDTPYSVHEPMRLSAYPDLPRSLDSEDTDLRWTANV